MFIPFLTVINLFFISIPTGIKKWVPGKDAPQSTTACFRISLHHSGSGLEDQLSAAELSEKFNVHHHRKKNSIPGCEIEFLNVHGCPPCPPLWNQEDRLSN